MKQQSADITHLVFDMESLAVSAADTKVGDVPVKTVVLGEPYIARNKKTGVPDRFVCLLGGQGKSFGDVLYGEIDPIFHLAVLVWPTDEPSRFIRK